MPAIDPTLAAALHRELLASRIEPEEPGAVVAVFRDGELIAHTARGVADTETGAALTERTRMNIASVSKQLTAAAVVIVSREGRVDLDADIRAYVPELRLRGITLRGCLNHTAGLPDYMGIGEVMGLEILEVARLDWFTDWVSTIRVPDFPPGDAASYSNTGYVLAALAIERATGTPFPELIADRVFRPLGMDDTLVMELLADTVPNMSMSFERTDDGLARADMGVGRLPKVRGVNGDGEILTTLVDFAKWHGFLRDGRVLGDEVRRALLARAVLTDGQVSSYGLGIEHERRGELSAIAHSGGMWGYSTYSLLEPDSGLSVAVFANRDDLDPAELAWRALRIAARAGGIGGRWFSERFAFGLELAVRADGGLTAADGTERSELVAAGAGRWTQDDDLGLVELRDGELFVAAEFGLQQRFQRLSVPGPVPEHGPGDFTEPYGGAAYRIEQRESGVVVVHPSNGVQNVTPYGERGSSGTAEWIGAFDGGYLLIERRPAGRVRIGSGTTVTELTRKDG
ncbi:serine hydrolase domain-containing protein [Leucobacter iarius]|uniref:Beta-lactamase-related domain-containing protein n=1 Tax=Leucobacter iarius TaxID=333963 RepID=A0ABN2LVE8_9MICO